MALARQRFAIAFAAQSDTVQRPIILVGNKIDLRKSTASTTLNDVIMPLMQTFSVVLAASRLIDSHAAN
jgi:hypothetical protein